MHLNQDDHSHLFLVRFWSEGVQDAQNTQSQKELSGRVQHILSGEARTFHDWPTLIDLLREMAETEGIDVNAPRVKSEEVLQ